MKHGPVGDQGPEPTAVGFSVADILRQLPPHARAELRREAERCRPGGRLQQLLEEAGTMLRLTQLREGER